MPVIECRVVITKGKGKENGELFRVKFTIFVYKKEADKGFRKTGDSEKKSFLQHLKVYQNCCIEKMEKEIQVNGN